MARLSELRQEAKNLGIAASEIRGAESADELRALIAAHSGGNGSSTKTKGRKAVKKAVAKKKSNSTAKTKTAAKKSSAVKSRPAAKKTAKRATAGKTTRKAASNGDLKRNLLDGVNFSHTDGWNPREGSPPDLIVKALRKAKGNRERAYDLLSGKINDLVTKKTRGGRTRDKAERENYLRYLISRNAWAFAIATGQHEKAEGRAEYGTAGTGEGLFKPAGKRKTAAKKATARSRKTKATRKGTTRAKAKSKRK